MSEQSQCVVLVDDDDLAISIFEKMYKRAEAPYELLTFDSGVKFCDYMKDHADGDHNPILVFLDVQMPVMNGFQVVEKIRKMHLPMQPLIYMFTSSDNKQDFLKSVEVGANEYMTKPLGIENYKDLFSKVFKELDEHISTLENV